MSRLRLIAVGVVIVFSFAYTIDPLRAQTPAGPDAALTEISVSIVRAIGAQDKTVEITTTHTILKVLRVNSNMNEATHAGRDNEATAIASIVSKAISGKSEFTKLNTIRVQYVTRPSPNANSRVVDTVDFRKDPQGVFQFHRT
jgi:hypothetical protein